MTTQTIARATVEINRVHPDARDISVSSRGHEPIIRNTWASGTTFNEINAWIASVSPEVNVNGTPSYANDPDQYSAFYFLPSAKDARGYSTYTYIRLYFAPVEIEAPKPTITEEMMLGTSVFQGDETVNLHTIPNGAQPIITGYSLSTPSGYALFGIRKSNERVRIKPTYVPTLEDATQTLVRDAFAYAARPATPAVPAAAAWEDFQSSYRPLSTGGWFIDENGEDL